MNGFYRFICRLVCLVTEHIPKPHGDGYHYCGRCGEEVLYEKDGWRL